MGNIKEINIKKRTYYFFDDMNNINNFHSSLLKIDKSFRNKYVINSVNLLYLIVDKVDGFIEEKGNKYLNFAFAGNNSEVLKKYAEIWSGIKNEIKAICSGESGECRKDNMKIKFNSDDDLPLNKQLKFIYLTPLNKQLKFINLTIIVRAVFEEDGKYYPQTFLDQSLYEL